MKINRPKGAGATSGPKKSSSSQTSGDADFSQFVTGGASESASTAQTQSIAQLDVLLAVQETEDPTKKAAKKRAQLRSDSILDKLEQIRIKMLTGDLTVGHLIDVADVVASHREKIDDPKLTSIMDEVDLRAQVEIAKMRVSIEATKA